MSSNQLSSINNAPHLHATMSFLHLHHLRYLQVLQGKAVLVVAARHQALHYLESFLRVVKPERLHIIADEGDLLWTHEVTPAMHRKTPSKDGDTSLTCREAVLYRLLQLPFVFSLLQVRATPSSATFVGLMCCLKGPGTHWEESVLLTIA